MKGRCFFVFLIALLAGACLQAQDLKVLVLRVSARAGDVYRWWLEDELRYLVGEEEHSFPLHPGGHAADLQTHLRTAEQFARDSAVLRREKVKFIGLDFLRKWDIPRVAASYRRRGKDLYALKFGDALAELTGGRLREGREVRWGHPGGTYFDGLLPYTYDGKHCFLLWDDRRKWKKIGAQNPFWHDNWGNEPAIYDFTYSLRGAQQLVLCRWREECYVLLLLTRPMFLPGE